MDWGNSEILGALLLFLGVLDDLRSRKVHNSLILTILFLTLALPLLLPSFFPLESTALLSPLLALGLAFVLVLPLFGLKIWGGGDAKLFLALSPLLLWSEIPIFILTSLAWGAVLGLVRIVLSGGIGPMLETWGQLIFHRQPVNEHRLTRIPFSVALFFGYLTLLTLRRHGGIL